MTKSLPYFQPYSVGDRRESIMRFGPKDSPQILILEPLFEERNSLRSTIVEIARGLAELGLGCALPDLPGTGESVVPLNNVKLGELREAAAQVSMDIEATCVVTFRSGALLARDFSIPQCHIALMSGPDLSRHLGHLKTATDEGADFGGYQLHQSFLEELPNAQYREDYSVEATELPSRPWLRTEPCKDSSFSRYVIGIIEKWARTCDDI